MLTKTTSNCLYIDNFWKSVEYFHTFSFHVLFVFLDASFIIRSKEGDTMKHLLIVTLENTDDTARLLYDLSFKGYNATVYSTTSLKHVLHDENEDIPTILTLSHLLSHRFVNNTTIFFVLDETTIEDVKNLIRKDTDNFRKVKGGMWVAPLEFYEGSF